MFSNNNRFQATAATPTIVHVQPMAISSNDEGLREAQVITNNSNENNAVPTASEIHVPTTWAALTATVVPETEHSDGFERERLLLNLYQRARFIRIICFVQLVFIIILGLFLWLFFLLIIFPIAGFYGAKKWNYYLLYVYSFYLVVEIFGGIISMIYIKSTGYLIVRALYIALDVLMLRYSVNLCSFLQILEEADLEFLKSSPIVINFEKTSLC